MRDQHPWMFVFLGGSKVGGSPTGISHTPQGSPGTGSASPSLSCPLLQAGPCSGWQRRRAGPQQLFGGAGGTYRCGSWSGKGAHNHGSGPHEAPLLVGKKLKNIKKHRNKEKNKGAAVIEPSRGALGGCAGGSRVCPPASLPRERPQHRPAAPVTMTFLLSAGAEGMGGLRALPCSTALGCPAVRRRAVSGRSGLI